MNKLFFYWIHKYITIKITSNRSCHSKKGQVIVSLKRSIPNIPWYSCPSKWEGRELKQANKHVLWVFWTASKISVGMRNYTFYADIVLQIHCATEYKRLPSLAWVQLSNWKNYGPLNEQISPLRLVSKQDSSHFHSLCVSILLYLLPWVFIYIKRRSFIFWKRATWWWNLLVWRKTCIRAVLREESFALNLTATQHVLYWWFLRRIANW